MHSIKIGLLPLYIALYDDHGSSSRTRLEPFYEALAQGFEAKNITVVRAPFCRLHDEFKQAVASFEAAGVDCIVTWHAAYSPSLESAEVLSATSLPIVILDTTETFDFGFDQNPKEIDYCHGIHGVMDMANLLIRHRKPFAIAAGHYPSSDVLDRSIGFIRAAVAAQALKGSRVGSIGGSFQGMGDFLISDSELKERFGVTVVYADGKELAELKNAVSEKEVKSEMEADLSSCSVLEPFSPESHRLTVQNCLAVRNWLKKHDLAAFTANFLEIRPETGLDVMPFMEACKAMARGVGYAGEGDVLTASITGALMQGFPDTAFIEIFCPDWKGDTLFISHFAEMNYNLAADKPELREIPYSYGKAANPVVGFAGYRGGKAVYLNIFRDADEYRLLIAPVTMLSTPKGAFTGQIRGWMKPPRAVSDFLQAISRAGVTHHSCLIYGADIEQLEYFGQLLGLKVTKILSY